MKMIVAYIRHEAFEPIRADLLDAGFPSLSISEVKGSGRQKGITERYRGAELTNYLRPKLKIECVVADSDVELIVETILRHARTGSRSRTWTSWPRRSNSRTALAPTKPDAPVTSVLMRPSGSGRRSCHSRAR